jgi:hypothetical protein
MLSNAHAADRREDEADGRQQDGQGREMKYMLLLRASGCDASDESGSERERVAMAAFNEQLLRAGVVLAGAGVAVGETDVRVEFDGEHRAVTTVPAGDADEAVCAFWILQVSSRSEAVEWARRIPATRGFTDVRRVLEAGEREYAT